MRALLGALLAIAIALAVPNLIFASPERPVTVASATLSTSGVVRISYSDGSEIAAPKLKDQVGFGRPIVARDRRTVGWLAMFPNCCTSYPIPMALVIYRDGKVLQSLAPQMPIWHWRFLGDGDRVVCSTDVVHGGTDLSVDYSLYEVNTGKQLASWSLRESKEQPEWVGLLKSDNTNDLYP